MEAIPAGTTIPLDPEHFRELFTASPIAYTPDHSASAIEHVRALAEVGIRSSINLGVYVADEPIGTLNVATARTDGFPAQDQAVLVALASFMGSTLERIMAQEKLSHEADHDHLTGLLHRDIFEEELAEELLRLRSEPTSSALCFVDIDAFKLINDQYGHLAGDVLLRDIAARIQQCIGVADVPARIGGDEILILLRSGDMATYQRIAGDIVDAVSSTAFFAGGNSVDASISLGLCQLDGGVASVQEAIGRADAACYTVKKRGGDGLSVASDADREQEGRRASAGQIALVRTALADGDLKLAAQPIQRLSDGRVDAVELLIRLRHDGADQPASAIIPAVERYGMTGTIDQWVVRETGRRWATLLDTFGSDCTVFLNLSANSLCLPGFDQQICAALDDSGVQPAQVCFEITETGTMHNFEAAVEFIHRLKRCGVSFALDDFGVGLSSLGHLRRLPVDYLKIDGSLIGEVAQDPVLATMVKSIAAMGEALGVDTIAEHVENEATLAKLADIGVDRAQGFLIGRPTELA